MLPDAEKSGYWLMVRPRIGKKGLYHGYQVYQLFLTPVHPKKRNEAKHILPAVDASFLPVEAGGHTKIRVHAVELSRAKN